MFVATKDRILPTTVVGSYPRPHWYRESLRGRPFKLALADGHFREQYLDAVACTTADQPPRVTGPLTRGPLEYAAVWKMGQRVSTGPLKFGSVSAQSIPSMLINEHYPSERELIWDLCQIVNTELREVAAAGSPVIQVEEPGHHFRARNPATTDDDLQFLTSALNREIAGLRAQTEVWVHTCWGNPNQQSMYWERPSYERALPYFWQLDADVITFECASTGGIDLPLIAECPVDKKIAIGVVSHTNTTVEPPELVAALIRKALEHIPAERLILTSDCGFGREGLSRRIAFYKCVSLVQGVNLVRRELGLDEAPVPAADERLSLGPVPAY
jgi:5-methyltetrahydropteroyltriglutamate--homocysteine methyltransferase